MRPIDGEPWNAPEGFDPSEFNHVADELCLVVSLDHPLPPADAPRRAAALYQDVLGEVNGRIGSFLKGAPDPAASSSDVLRRLLRVPQPLAPLDRLNPPDGRPGALTGWVVLPRQGDTTTVLCFYAVRLGQAGPAGDPAAEVEYWSGPDLLQAVGLLVNRLNRSLPQLPPVPIEGGHRRILAATPNWLSAVQSGDHEGGGPGSLPSALTAAQLADYVRGHAEGQRPWRFEFANQDLQAVVQGARGRAREGAQERVVVAVLDTCPDKEAVRRAAEAFPENWLLREVYEHVAFDGDLVPFAGPADMTPFSHLRFYLPNWRGGLRRWRNAFLDRSLTTADRDRLRAGHYAMPDHGLFVSGIIRDIAPTAQVHLIRVLDDTGVGDLAVLTNTLRALPERLLSGENQGKRLVVNLSLMVDVPRRDVLRRVKQGPPGGAAGGLAPSPYRWLLDGDDTYDTLHASLRETIAALAEQGVLIVAAAGNDALTTSPPPEPRLPAGYETILPNVLAVAAVRSDETPAHFSNRGNVTWSGHGIAAFGGEAHLQPTPGALPEIPPLNPDRMDAPAGVFSAPALPLGGPKNETGWVFWAGTSFSTPVVSALAADFWARDPQLTPAAVINRVRLGATEPEAELQCRSIMATQP